MKNMHESQHTARGNKARYTETKTCCITHFIFIQKQAKIIHSVILFPLWRGKNE